MNQCAHCRYSIDSLEGLMCQRFARPVRWACLAFQREPGADDE